MKRPLLALLLAACAADDAPMVRARQITSLDEAIGGPTANGRVGDFLLENEKIRAVVEGGGISYLPTDVGGNLIDLDLQRPQAAFRSGRGLDQLGEIAPMANLSVVQASQVENVRITRSREGVEVTAAAVAAPVFRILNALTLLIQRRFAMNPVALNMYTEYEVRPGESMVRIVTTVGYNVPLCAVTEADGCNPECDDALYDSDCQCPQTPSRCRAGTQLITATPLPDRATASILDVILGDLPRPFGTGSCTSNAECNAAAGETCVPVTTAVGGSLSLCRAPTQRDAGQFLGDLLVFSGQLTPFVRNLGYDTETDIRRLFDIGRDTLSEPLQVDAVFATGDRYSLGYLSPAGDMLVPIFRGSFSLGATHAATCATGEPRCLDGKLVRFERWISVGEGDVASAQAPLLEAAGRAFGTVRGTVSEEPSGHARSGIDVYAVHDPRSLPCDAACQARCPIPAGAPESWSLDQLRDANRCRTRGGHHPEGHTAVESFARTDPGTDPILDGGFELKLPPGDYVLVAFDKHEAQSRLRAVTVAAGAVAKTHLGVPEAATLEYAVFDDAGRLGPGKITVGHLPGKACAADGECATGELCQAGACALPWGTLQPLEFGGRRPVDGVLWSEGSVTGTGRFDLPPGDYDVLLSRGPHYSSDRQRVTLEARRTTKVEGAVRRVLDREGWIAAGLHVHAARSIDSDTSMPDRVKSFLIEDMDLLTSSDHDYITSYDPLVRQLGVADRINTMTGLEVTTQEYGHYLAFPVRHEQWQDGERLPNNNAVQWRGKSPQEIIDAARELATPDYPVVVDIPHPYDYFDFYRVDPVSLEPESSLLVLINPLLDPSFFTGDYEIMELANTKNFHRIRRATTSEVRFYSEGLDALIRELEAGTIDADTFQRRWLNLGTESTRRRLHRTVSEQDAALAGEGNEIECLCGSSGTCAAGQVCEVSTMTCVPAPGSPNPPPPADSLCRLSRGVIDDWFNMLNRGVFRTGVAGADAHGREAGFMRTLVRYQGTTAPFIGTEEMLDAIQAGRAIVSNGPMVHFSIDSAGIGDTVPIDPGGQVTLSVRVEKAPWYDVDRIEIYRNGRLVHWANGCDRARGSSDADADPHPCIAEGDGAVLAWDRQIVDQPDRDAWYVVLVYGLDGRTLAPVYESQVLAEIGTPEITQRLFTIIPGLQEFKFPTTPSIFPVFPFAFTNPIWVDVGRDGWNPPLPAPSWCRQGDKGCSSP